MTDTRINSTIVGDLENIQENFSVNETQTDAQSNQKETIWINTKWGKQLGYYKLIPELKAVIDARARWAVGKGFKTDTDTQVILENITGYGSDTFNTIIENQERTSCIGGDSFAEIILDEEGNLLNLKPLDPSTIQIIVNKKGLIIGFRQIAKIGEKVIRKFKPEEIFHLPRDRVADEIHGVSMLGSLKDIIDMRNEAMQDMKKLMHRHVKPLVKFILDTDDEDEISKFQIKADIAVAKGENLYLPKGTAEHEIISVPANSTLNPLPWIESLNKYFYQAAGVPQIIVGGSSELTEATAKIAYLTFQQTVEEEQLFIEEQLLSQLGIRVKFDFPASIENELLSDNKKDGAENIDASEMTAGEGQ